ncbi:MAG: LapA family protein, partial [Acidimicrobiia bacterium]
MSESEVVSAPSAEMNIADSPSPGIQTVADSLSTERVFVGTGLFWGLIVGVLLATTVIALAAQNTGSISVDFLGWHFSTSLIVVILGALLIGVVLDELFGLFYRGRRR